MPRAAYIADGVLPTCPWIDSAAPKDAVSLRCFESHPVGRWNALRSVGLSGAGRYFGRLLTVHKPLAYTRIRTRMLNASFKVKNNDLQNLLHVSKKRKKVLTQAEYRDGPLAKTIDQILLLS